MNNIVTGLGLALIFFVSAVSSYFVVHVGSHLQSNVSANSVKAADAKVTLKNVSACDVLTDKIAKSILGENLIHPDAGPAKSPAPDPLVTICNYAAQDVAQATSANSTPQNNGISLMVRNAKTQATAVSNQQQFDVVSADNQAVKGLGDRAFYYSKLHQLHVLKGGNWYIITSYVGTTADGTLDNEKILAYKFTFK